MFERIDLHLHSHHSDGTLSPRDLVALALTRKVGLMSLTDHDTTAGCAEAAAACAATGSTGSNAVVRFLPGIELTADWLGREVHVVGLAIDAEAAPLRTYCAAVVARRRERAAAIVARLIRNGVAAETLGAALAFELPDAEVVPTRTHLARALRRMGLADSVQGAFDRWLGQGQPGYVAPAWPAMAEAVACLRAAGGLPVLAHAHRYRCSAGQLRALCAAFTAAGGRGLEVSLAGMSDGDRDRLCALARRHGLAGSVGSDFHEPGLAWRPLGRFAKLPEDIAPITELLARQA